MVKIRLFRMGKRHVPFYRIVVIDSRAPRNGKYIESIGYYDPRGKELKLDLSKVKDWLKKGARPTNTVAKLIKRKEEVANERTN
ncbi:30S ribosomal protein S16 [candidate division WOR-3 bacterium]|nr:30S ribosomal protein S16 [candidate division WOR-3 bacterium]